MLLIKRHYLIAVPIGNFIKNNDYLEKLSISQNMKKGFIFIFALLPFMLQAQKSLDKLLKKYNDNGVPYISVQELAIPKAEVILLDARELKEYEVSHIKNAICVGYDNFNLDEIKKQLPNKNDQIVVYCSLGIRSETIAEKLKKAGYKNVLNLYGGIFEWKNNNFPVYNAAKKETDSIHAFSLEWSKWLKKGIKVYE